jgi:hypothetical protein
MQKPQLPLIPRLVNGVGRLVAPLGIRPVSLDPESLLAGARDRVKLEDFGDDDFREGLSRVTSALESEAALSLIGRFVVRQDLLSSLGNRLEMVDWHKRHPEIAEQPIRRPIVIVGQGRSGTTILHELMTLDPANRVPLTWEVDRPAPPPERATYETDARIDEVQHQLDQAERLIPDFKRMHRMGARLPQECVRMTASEFRSLIFTATWRVPSYTRWLLREADMSPVYRAHRRMLQLLQWRCPAERWVLKSPGHIWSLEALLAEYPDACLVQTHRDPLKILSSISSLEVVLRAMTSDDIDPHEIAREWSEWFCLGYERSVTFREAGGVPDSQVMDVQFGDFIGDPVSQVRRIYEHFDLEFTEEFDRRMREYVASNPSDRDGRHEHSFAGTGLDVEEERAKVKRYQEYFDVASEDRL